MLLKPREIAETMSIAVIGTGYVGLTTAACLAHLGRSVVAIDVDEGKVAALNRGELPILELGLESVVGTARQNGHLEFTTSYAACTSADIIVLCLPTPFCEEGGLDLRILEDVVCQLRTVVAAGSILVVKSTVPVGTHELLTQRLERPDVGIAANPEFLREGNAVADFLQPDRIVIGATTPEIGGRVAAVYNGIDAPVQVTDPASAELIKYGANSFLAAKLSFANELSRLCDGIGADIEAVIEGIGSDHRIGNTYFSPGPGWGGSCFPKDTRGLTHTARSRGQYLPVAEAAYASNREHIAHIVAEIQRFVPTVHGVQIAVWGASFKAGTDDVRDSPAIAVIEAVLALGATVTVFDPAAPPDRVPGSNVDDPYTACIGADLLLVLTEWSEFAEADLEKVANLMAGRSVFDARYVIDVGQARATGLDVRQPGRPTT